MSIKNHSRIRAIACFMLLISILLCGCRSVRLPCEKGPGYWMTDNGALWFYTNGNDENYAEATGEIITADGSVPISISWHYTGNFTVSDTDGKVLFTGRTYLSEEDLADGKCNITIDKWSANELFQEKEMLAVWCGDKLPD